MSDIRDFTWCFNITRKQASKLMGYILTNPYIGTYKTKQWWKAYGEEIYLGESFLGNKVVNKLLDCLWFYLAEEGYNPGYCQEVFLFEIKEWKHRGYIAEGEFKNAKIFAELESDETLYHSPKDPVPKRQFKLPNYINSCKGGDLL